MIALGTSHRRQLLDAELARLARRMSGRVVDVGGRRRRRGAFAPPPGVARWLRLNVDPAEGADVVADAEALPLRTGSADWVVCVEVLEYVRAPERALAEIARVLAGPGVAVVSVPFLHRADAPADRHRFTEVRLRELVAGAGLRAVEVLPQGRFFTTLANFVRQGVARVPSRPVRWLLALLAVPAGHLLVRLDRLERVRRSAFLSSFTTGFLVVAERARPHGG